MSSTRRRDLVPLTLVMSYDLPIATMVAAMVAAKFAVKIAVKIAAMIAVEIAAMIVVIATHTVMTEIAVTIVDVNV